MGNHGSDRRQYSSCSLHLLTPAAAGAVAELYTEVFLNDEPMTYRHQADPAVFLPYARIYLALCAELQLSFVAVDDATGQVTAFVLGSDLTTDWEAVAPGMAGLLSLFPESMAIIRELEGRCPDLRDARPGLVLHLFQLGVSRDYRGRGLGTGLVRCILSRAGEQGFARVVADCTGPVSRHTCEKCGFHEAARVVYDDFVVDGRAFFSGIPGGISLMVRDL